MNSDKFVFLYFVELPPSDMPFCNLLLQSVLDGYNGTIMAYGQTGTGKTYTLGRLGEEDTAARGIMVRAMEDILADVSFETDSVSVSYLQVVVLQSRT
jgi:Cdc6-like AAA superfamily ATPase